MAAALVRHDELVAGAVESHGGRFLKSKGEGDATFSVFESASDAVQAAIAATRALGAEPWPNDWSITARFGIHTGEAERRDDDYFGPAVNLAARVRGQGGGGEILLSQLTADLTAKHLPAGYSLVALGPHRLRGVEGPQTLHAVAGPGVTAPAPATQCPYRGLLAFDADDRAFFFGREAVLGSVIERLAPRRLLALVGASGSGKSSLLRAGLIASVGAGEVPGVTSTRLVHARRAAAGGDRRRRRDARRRGPVRGAVHALRRPRSARALHRRAARPSRAGGDRRARRLLRRAERASRARERGRLQPGPARRDERGRAATAR